MKTDRYKGQIVLPEISLEGQKAISKSSVSIVGIGGTGSLAAELFNRMGIGKLILIDGDRIRESNLHRQVLFNEVSVGELKVEAASARLKQENSETVVETYSEFLDDNNASRLLAGSDLVYDGTDNVMARHSINRFSVGSRIPWVMTSAIEYYGQAKAVVPGETSCIACMNYPEEESTLSCSEQGIFPPVLSWITSIGVSLAMDIITGKKSSGNFFHVDMKTMEMRQISAERNKDCRMCSSLK